MSELIDNLAKRHPTQLGIMRINRNLCLLGAINVVAYCIKQIVAPNTEITRSGKNFYVTTAPEVITINASKQSIITAHKVKK
jgi:hypothetical protein